MKLDTSIHGAYVKYTTKYINYLKLFMQSEAFPCQKHE